MKRKTKQKAKKKQRNEEVISKAQAFTLLFLAALFIMASPHMARLFRHSPMMIGEESYYHARIAGQIADSGMPDFDSMVYGSRPYLFSPYHSVLAIASYALGVELASVIIPFACGMLSVLLFYLIMKKLGFALLERSIASIVFILSPAFIYSFATSTPVCVAALLSLVGFYFFMQEKDEDGIIAIAVLAVSAFFSITSMLIALIIPFGYSLYNKKMKPRFFALLFFVSIVFLFYYVGIYFRLGIPLYPELAGKNLIQQFITDLGGIFGFSIFSLMLACIGIAVIWKEKRKFYYAYLLMIFVAAASFFWNSSVIYSNFIVSILAGIAFAALIRRKWELKVVRNLSIILLFCSVLFSAVSYTVRISGEQPSNGLIEAAEWIGLESDEGDVVFSHYTKGFWVQYSSGRQVVADSNFAYLPEAQERLDDSKAIFESWDIEATKRLLKKYNIRFVLLTKDMSEGLVWEKPEQGLAYLVRNNETFKKEFSNADAGVWRFMHSGK